jgi:hypothetical protein
MPFMTKLGMIHGNTGRKNPHGKVAYSQLSIEEKLSYMREANRRAYLKKVNGKLTRRSPLEMTDELKNKLSEKSKGNTNVRGTKWWTDGTVNKRSKECPGINFILGTTKK